MLCRYPLTLALTLTLLGGCGDEVVEVLPICDEIDWPLGVDPDTRLPAPEYAVECADGWGNHAETRPALTTTVLPNGFWDATPHPTDGWVLVSLAEYYPTWGPWFEQHDVDLDSIQSNFVLVWITQDGGLGWVLPEFEVWSVEFDGDHLWALARDSADARWLLDIDPASGALLDQRALDFRYNWMSPAPDPAGGVWITAIEAREQDDLYDQSLFRVTSDLDLELVAMRTTQGPRQSPSGGVLGLPDGAAAWMTLNTGFELIEPDGSVRWTRSEGYATAGGADSLVVVSHPSTGVGAGQLLGLEKVSTIDGATLWAHEHQRFVVSDPDRCGPDDCRLLDLGSPRLQADGGYLLVGGHAYPDESCAWQPLVMAISAGGEVEWEHRVDTCGYAYFLANRDDGTFDVLASTTSEDGSDSIGLWSRSFAYP